MREIYDIYLENYYEEIFMYILIVARGYPSERYKMNGIFEFDQAKALAKAGHKVIYAAIDVRSIRHKRQWGFESFKKDGVQIEAINIPCGGIHRIIQYQIRLIALRILSKRIFRKHSIPDLIHAHFISNSYITARVFGKSNIPIISTEHFSAMNKDKLPPYLLKVGKYTYPRMNKVITVSTLLAESLNKKFGVKPIIVPNILDTTSFKYTKKKGNINAFTFVATGSLITRKGMDILIQAFYKAFKGDKNVRLYIFGDGPERNKLERLINSLNLSDQVFLMGLVDRKKIADKMSESDCFVLASRRETFGVAYIEAMAMGLPVIATKCGGPEDFVTNENGILVPVDDIDKLKEALIKMHQNIDLYDREKISSSTKKSFAPSTIAERLIEVYKDVLRKK